MHHSPEPWEMERDEAHCADGPCIRDSDNNEVLFPCCEDCRGEQPIMEEYDARRIVACVNALVGISTEVLEAKQFQLVAASSPDQPEAEWSAQWESIAKEFLEKLGYNVRPLERKLVTGDGINMDLTIQWFPCPVCNTAYIPKGVYGVWSASYCPDCGSKVRWE